MDFCSVLAVFSDEISRLPKSSASVSATHYKASVGSPNIVLTDSRCYWQPTPRDRGLVDREQ